MGSGRVGRLVEWWDGRGWLCPIEMVKLVGMAEVGRLVEWWEWPSRLAEFRPLRLVVPDRVDQIGGMVAVVESIDCSRPTNRLDRNMTTHLD
jgi:hypothetical protein